MILTKGNIEMSMLEIRNLNVIYKVKGKEIKAVNNFNIDIDEEDSIGIVGESGSGKSTLAMAMLKLLPEKVSEVEGSISYKGIDLLELGAEEFKKIRWKDISIVFQKSMNSLSPVHKIGNQIIDVYKVHSPKAKDKEIRKRIIELFKLVNLSEDVLNYYPHELSGGMMQRVSIALALINYPKLLIMDESTTALDAITQSQILNEIMKLEESLKLTRIMITHDLSVVCSTCKKIAVMYAGYLLEEGYVKEVLEDPKHPYTEELLNSYPSLDVDKETLTSIKGSLPDLSIVHKGCIFADRCRKAQSICFMNNPKMICLSGGRRVACHLIGGIENE